MTFVLSSLLWCVLQVTLIAIMTVILVGIANRFNRPLARTALLCGLGAMFIVTLLAASPLPRWPLNWGRVDPLSNPVAVPSKSFARSTTTLTDEATPSANPMNRRPVAPDGTPVETRLMEASNEPPMGVPSTQESSTSFPETAAQQPIQDPSSSELSRSFVAETSLDRVTESAKVSSFLLLATGWIVVGFISFGIVRWMGGLLALRRLLVESRRIEHPTLATELSVLREHFGIHGSIDLVENHHIRTAATIGSRRPVILLPPSWRDWSDAQRQAILAHEVSHVKQHDFVWGLFAQLCVAASYYHPLAHWINRRLHLEMEVQADAAAVAVVGSSQTYLRTLAEIADRQDRWTLNWPARSFFQTPSTLIRRVEMLQRNEAHAPQPPGRYRCLLVMFMVAVVFGALGLRGSGAATQEEEYGRSEAAQDDDVRQVSVSAVEEDNPWKYVPEEMEVLFTLRLDKLPNSEEALLIAEQMTRSIVPNNVAEAIGPSLTSATRFTYMSPYTSLTLRDVRSHGVMMLEFENEEAIRDIWARAGKEGLNSARFLEELAPLGWNGYDLMVKLDQATICIAYHNTIERIVSAKSTTLPELKSSHWMQASQKPIALFVRSRGLQRIVESDFFRTALSPYWVDCRAFIASASLEPQTDVEIVAFCDDADSVERIRETSDAVATLVRTNFQRLPDRAKSIGGKEEAALQQVAEATLELLTSRVYETNLKDATLTVNMKSEALDESAIAELLASRNRFIVQEQLQEEDINKLKRIGLALHNYHDTYQHFPPAVIKRTTADGRVVEHSWRVAILPFLEHADLYEQYDFDQPWDSETNLKVLNADVEVFRSSINRTESPYTGFVAVTGPGTVLGRENGISIKDLQDGYKNTILFLMLERDIPWTKPEDLQWNPETVKHDLGLDNQPGIWVGFASGFVCYIENGIDPTRLNAFMTVKSDNKPAR